MVLRKGQGVEKGDYLGGERGEELDLQPPSRGEFWTESFMALAKSCWLHLCLVAGCLPTVWQAFSLFGAGGTARYSNFELRFRPNVKKSVLRHT